jgi:flagellar brake protein
MLLSALPARLAAPACASEMGTASAVGPRSERIRLLQKLCDEHSAVSLHASHDDPHSADAASLATHLTARLWAVDSVQSSLSWHVPADHPGLDELVQAPTLQAVALLDDAQLQFRLHSPLLVHSDARCVLQAALPEEMQRIQRRDAYRVPTPERLAPTARFRHPSLPDMPLALRVLDISLGGCALWLPHDVPPLQAGSHLAQALIELDTLTRFKTSLDIHHINHFHAGHHGVRLGCAWLPLPGPAQRTLQRWIDHTQKRQRLLAAGADKV